MTKKIKSRVKSLKNQRLSLEAKAINENANRREIEELYRRMKSQDSALKNLKQGSQWPLKDTSKLKEYFLQHFNITSTFEDPIEIVKAPNFIKFLQDIPGSIMETNPPDKEELRLTIDSLKKGRHYCRALVEECPTRVCAEYFDRPKIVLIVYSREGVVVFC